MTEEQLQGGFVNVVVRVGDTVRRQPGERAGFVHELLRHFEAQEWPGAPRFLGIDDDGREMLSYVAGYVAWITPRSPATTSLESLGSIGRLVRELHDLTAVGQPDLLLPVDRWRAICDGSGPTDRSALVDTVLWWQDRTWRGIEAAASTGDGPMSRLVQLGVPADIRKAHDWVAANADVLESALQ